MASHFVSIVYGRRRVAMPAPRFFITQTSTLMITSNKFNGHNNIYKLYLIFVVVLIFFPQIHFE